MKIVLFGDSLLSLFHKPYIQDLESKIPGTDVYNCAAGGWNTEDGVIKAPYIASLNPEVIVISLGMNDAAPWKQVHIEKFKTNLATIFDIFETSKIIFFLPPPVDEKKQTEGRRRTNAAIQIYADAARHVCNNKSSVELVDSWEIFTPLLENEVVYHEDDGVHLNEYGNSLLITHLSEAINSK